ncbi:proton-coupled zinc antiporter SLC30A5-like isoform X2 [Tachypleus tridentatus]
MNGKTATQRGSLPSLSPNRAIYPSSRISGFVVFLVITKVLLGLCYFLAYDILKAVHVVQFLFIIKAIISTVFILIQKPFSSGKKLSKKQWLHIVRHAVISSTLSLLALFGLTQCGPLRTALLVQHNDLVVIAVFRSIFTGAGGHSKFRGAICFLVAIFSLLFLDHDDNLIPTDHPEGHHHHGVSHLFYYSVSWLGLADHKAGVLLLVLVVGLQTGFNSASKRLANDVGGTKHLHAISSLTSTVLLAPWAFFLRITKYEPSVPWTYLLVPLSVVAVCMFMLDYYVAVVAATHLEGSQQAKLGSLTVFVAVLVFSWVWRHSTVASLQESQVEHALSGGVIFSWIMFILATLILTGPPSKGWKGTFVGYSSGGLPLYTFTGDALHRTSRSAVVILKNGLHEILRETDSRKIFYFLCLSLGFTFIELLYGVWTNSLGLISDGFHMLFDCSALVMGLSASLLARRKATRTFPYGYARVEVLSGFINGLFLVVVAFMVFTEALSRLFDPPEIHTEKLLTVSVAGLVVNLVGILVFRHAHSHGHSHNHSHGHSHNHSHGHSHHNHDNANIEGVFLHILADTLGSVGVIISSLLIQNFGFLIADPVCSLFISVLIFLSVLPLLKHSALVLLLATPTKLGKPLVDALNRVTNIEGVLSYRNHHFWQHSADLKVGSIHVQVRPDISDQKLINQVTTIFKDIGFNNFTVQVEKEEYFYHITGLSNSYQNVFVNNATQYLNSVTDIKAV